MSLCVVLLAEGVEGLLQECYRHWNWPQRVTDCGKDKVKPEFGSRSRGSGYVENMIDTVL